MQPRTFLGAAAAVAVILTAACSSQAGSPAVPAVGNAMHRTSAKPPPPCNPTLWASSLTNAVYGFTAANSAPCVTLTGPYNGANISAPIALAIGKNPNRLYVADLGNDRIDVFTYQGTFVKSWSTTLGGQAYQPWGVCVGVKGWVGVGNRQFSNTGALGNAEFFRTNTPNNGTATGYATGVLNSDQYCAFDRVNNFFVDGTASTGQKIAYLARGHVGAAAQSLVDSNQGSLSYWTGMYSRIDSPADDTLSVGAAVGSASSETIDNWKISGPTNGPLTFTAIAAYSLTSYPTSVDPLYQLAPSPGGGTGTVFAADYGTGQILGAPANGGAVTVEETVSATTGVTTRPSGQY